MPPELVSDCCQEPTKPDAEGVLRCTYCFEPCASIAKVCPECEGNGGYWSEELLGGNNEVIGGDWVNCPTCGKKPFQE